MPRLATLIGGLLLSRGARRMAGRNAGKLALATLAWQLFQNSRRAGGQTIPDPRGPQRRWSGRRP